MFLYNYLNYLIFFVIVFFFCPGLFCSLKGGIHASDCFNLNGNLMPLFLWLKQLLLIIIIKCEFMMMSVIYYGK